MGISDALFDLIWSIAENRFQRVVLNGQTSEWLPVKAYVPQGSILGPLFFLIYNNDLSIDILSTVKLFADNTSLFSIIYDAKATAYELDKDLQKIAEWLHQWKMSFNPYLNKQSQGVIFQGKWLNHFTLKYLSIMYCTCFLCKFAKAFRSLSRWETQF